MSAPDTNTEKQVRQNRGPLYGIALAAGFAGVLFVAFLLWTAYNGNDPSEDDAAVATEMN